MRLSPAVLLFLLLCGSLPSSSIQSACDVKCHTPKTCIMTTSGDDHSIECKAKLGMRLDSGDYYTAGKKWMCNDREYGAYWTDTDPNPEEPKAGRTPPKQKIAAWRTIKTLECVEKLPCHLMSPLVSSCRDTLVCQQIAPANSEKVECNKNSADEYRLYATNSVTMEMQRVPHVECNDETGEWMSKNLSGPFVLPKGSNIRCLRLFKDGETDKFGQEPDMAMEIMVVHAKIFVKEFYQTGALLCLLSCFLSAVLACWMYRRNYLPRIRAYKHEWSGKQIHGGWRENYGNPRRIRSSWRITKWLKWVTGRDRRPRPTLQNVYDDISTCVSLTEESDFSSCEDCDKCKICPDWMDCGSLDDLADHCSTCSGGEACCSISTCSCTGPQAETTALSWSGGISGTDDSEVGQVPHEDDDGDSKCKCKRVARCDDRTCCILARIPKRKPMKGYRKKAKVAAKATKKMKETKEWQDFYSSTNARLMGINNETRLQKIKTKADIEQERKEREKEKEKEANPEKEKEEEAKRIRNKERLRLKVHEDGFDSSLAVDKILQIMQRYRDGYDGFEDNDDLEEDAQFAKADAKAADAAAYLKEVKRKAFGGKKKVEKEEEEEEHEEDKGLTRSQRMENDYKRYKERRKKEREEQDEKEEKKEKEKEKEKGKGEDSKDKKKEEKKKEEEKDPAMDAWNKEKEKMFKKDGEDEGPPMMRSRDGPPAAGPRPRNQSIKPIQSRHSNTQRKPVVKNFKDKKKEVIRHYAAAAKEENFGDYDAIATGTAVNLNNPKRLTRAETKRM